MVFWCFVFGVLYLVFCVWYFVFGVWYLVFRVWYLVFRVWCQRALIEQFRNQYFDSIKTVEHSTSLHKTQNTKH